MRFSSLIQTLPTSRCLQWGNARFWNVLFDVTSYYWKLYVKCPVHFFGWNIFHLFNKYLNSPIISLDEPILDRRGSINQNSTNNEQKRCKNMNFIFLRFTEVWKQRVPCKLNVTPFGHHLFCTWSVVFILPWTSEKWNLFLKWISFLKYERNGSRAKKWCPKHGTHCVHTSMNLRKMKFISYIYILFLHRFCSLFVCVFLLLFFI